MDMPRLWNATYLSSQTKNGMVDVIGNRIIRHKIKIIEEVKNARLYTVMID